MTKLLRGWQKLSADLTKYWEVTPKLVKTSLPNIKEKVQSSVDLRGAYQAYDRMTGLDHVRSLHEAVATNEKNFIDRQQERRVCQTECFRLEEARNRLNIQLDSVSRSDENFLRLVTQLHELSRQHKEAREQLSSIELAEQMAFDQFSSSLRLCQAEERVQAGRMRQWSIGLSVLAGFIGFMATYLRYNLTNKSPTSETPDLATPMLEAISQKLFPVIDDLQAISEQLKKDSTDLHPPPTVSTSEVSQSSSSTWTTIWKTTLIPVTLVGSAIVYLFGR